MNDSSPSLQQNVTGVDSSPSFESDSPIPELKMEFCRNMKHQTMATRY
jgi:hypothetical protein